MKDLNVYDCIRMYIMQSVYAKFKNGSNLISGLNVVYILLLQL